MRLFFLLLFLPLVAVADVEQTWPNLVIADENGTPIEGVTKSTSAVNALGKVLNLPYGTYKIIRPDATITTSGGAVEPPVILDSDGDGVFDDVDLCDSSPGAVVDATGCEVVIVAPPVTGGIPTLVYTRVPRTQVDDFIINGVEVSHWAYLDTLPEVGSILDGFNAPGQLVLRQPDGTEEIIYDCMNEVRPCVPTDAQSSLDGTKIIFSVYRADSLKPVWPENRDYPPRQLSSKNNEATIHIYDIATKNITDWPHTAGVSDMGPIFLPEGKVMFGSDRNPHYYPFVTRVDPTSGKAYLGPVRLSAPEPRLFIANEDGSNVKDITPHDFAGSMHPYLFSTGRVKYGSHWLSHNLPYTTDNGSVQWPGTFINYWTIQDIDREGGDMSVLLGGHRNKVYAANPGEQTMKAFHFLTELANGDACTTNYYRANNLGHGGALCWPQAPFGVEGSIANKFVQDGMYNLATYGWSEDAPSRIDPDTGKYMGKVGYPEGLPNGQAIVSYAQGYCTRVATAVPGTNNKLADAGQTDCNVGLYATTIIPSHHPSDLSLIVDHPEWHEFAARVIQARTIATPTLSKTGDSSCRMVSLDAGATDAHSFKEYAFDNRASESGNNGGELRKFPHSDVVAVRFYEAIPRLTSSTSGYKNNTGNEVRLLGDAPLLPDDSMVATVPCDTPLLMAGINADGRVIKRDTLPQSLRPGEKRVCSGCHTHSQDYVDGTYPDPEGGFYVPKVYESVLASTTTPTDLTTASMVPTYTDDIEPLFQDKCSSCHNQSEPNPDDADLVPLWNYESLVQDFAQITVPDSMRVAIRDGSSDTRTYGVQRPLTSKYVDNMFALRSLLYWKAAGRRTDGRTDSEETDDIDFGVTHNPGLTQTEIDIVGDWLDSGASL